MVRKIKFELKRTFGKEAPSVSSNYRSLLPDIIKQEGARLRGAWQSDVLPQKQRRLVDEQIAKYRSGGSIDVFDVLVAALRTIPDLATLHSVLEIGCSSGYYSEVLSIAGIELSYNGCDYSPAFIKMAKEHYPNLQFEVADACALAYESSAFDIVISGCCLLHIPEYEVAIAETARVAKKYAIFHRTPILLDEPTRHYKKQAYGVDTVEIHFNETELLALFEQHGLRLMHSLTLSEDVVDGARTAGRTYICEKHYS